MVRIPEGSAPDFKNKSWVIGAEVTIPENGASGVLATIGGNFGGWVLMLQDSKPEFVYALSNHHSISSASSPINRFRPVTTWFASPSSMTEAD